ncbi:MAG: GNAT family N-acetyltransferase [Fimbriimonadales bacterium]
MEEYIIREYRPGDDHSVSAVIKAVFEEYEFPWQPERYNADTHDIQAHYISKGGGFWVAEHAGVIVGAGAYLPIDYKTCELHRLYFLKDHRGKGVGGRMFCTVAKNAFEKGFQEMIFWSDKVLESAHAVYESYGAVLIGDRHVSDPEYASYDEWGFKLDLETFLSKRR